MPGPQKLTNGVVEGHMKIVKKDALRGNLRLNAGNLLMKWYPLLAGKILEFGDALHKEYQKANKRNFQPSNHFNPEKS